MRSTIQKAVHIEGIGVHSGRTAQVWLRPAASGFGVRINGVHVHLDTAIDARFSTTLSSPTGPVRTVEHLLAAVVGLELDDLDIQVDGGEVPILDGSARPWLSALNQRQRHRGTRWAVQPIRRLSVHCADGVATVIPARRLTLTVHTRFPNLSGHTIRVRDVRHVAHARTFGFLADAERMRAAGLALGASLDNTVVFDPQGHPLQPLRCVDEVTRHKALDLLGDLALLGAPLRARIRVERGGHRLHHALVAALLADHRRVPIT